MGTMLTGILAGVISIVAGVLTLRSSKNRQRREAEADVEKAERKIKEKKQKIKTAVLEKDDETVNSEMVDILPIVLAAFCVAGCVSKTPAVKYIPADRRIVSITNEFGVACKAVPDVVFVEMTDALIELKELKREVKVDKRVGQ